MKKEVIAFILFIIGVFLLGSSPSPTGAIIGIPLITSNFIGLIFFLSSLVLLLTPETLEARVGERKKSKLEEALNLAEKLIQQRYIPLTYRELKSLATKMGYEFGEGKKHTIVYVKIGKKYKKVTEIPRHKIKKGTARGILKDLSLYARYL